jgi:hypothetical protein
MDPKLFKQKLSEVCEFEMIPATYTPDKAKQNGSLHISKTAKRQIQQGVPSVPRVVSYPQQYCPHNRKHNNGKPKKCKITVAYTKADRIGKYKYKVEYCGVCRYVFLPNGTQQKWNGGFTHSRAMYHMVMEASGRAVEDEFSQS